jgi:hypothetical protein
MKKQTLVRDPKAGTDCYIFQPAGWRSQFAKVNVGVNRCGHIEDGICLDLADCEEPNRSQWHPGGVISFRDLEAIYFAARAVRAGNGTGKSDG